MPHLRTRPAGSCLTHWVCVSMKITAPSPGTARYYRLRRTVRWAFWGPITTAVAAWNLAMVASILDAH